MNEVIVSFLIGTSVGVVLAYFGIIYYAKYMEQHRKEFLIKAGKDKWEKKA